MILSPVVERYNCMQQPYLSTSKQQSYPFMKLVDNSTVNEAKPRKAIEANMYDNIEDRITKFISKHDRNQKQIIDIVRFVTQDVSVANTIKSIIDNVQKTWQDAQRYFEFDDAFDDAYATLTLVVKNVDSKKTSLEIDSFVEKYWKDFTFLKGKVVLATDHY